MSAKLPIRKDTTAQTGRLGNPPRNSRMGAAANRSLRPLRDFKKSRRLIGDGTLNPPWEGRAISPPRMNGLYPSLAKMYQPVAAMEGYRVAVKLPGSKAKPTCSA